ncbi:MAG: alpha/beta hydrolase fold domain-containing protein [Clostridia bacterium]|nr:alpha/beta hydrolase fold domain-containing protein [Clostridia bacterium]
MIRKEFIDFCVEQPKEYFLDKIVQMRIESENRIPPEVQLEFRKLDNDTTVEEYFLETPWATKYGIKSHVYVVKKCTGNSLSPVLINIHGGGWSLPHTERDTYFCRRIANRSGYLIIDIDYVLAPEYPYPAAIEEIEAVLNILPDWLPTLGGDVNNITLCGQSAGGNLLAAVMQRKQYSKSLNIQRQILCYLPTDNYTDKYHGEELNQRALSTEHYGFFYNPVFEDRKKPDVSLVYATADDLREIPKSDFILAGLDELCPEGIEYCELLRANGIETTLRVFENSRHGFLVNLYDEFQEAEDYLLSIL